MTHPDTGHNNPVPPPSGDPGATLKQLRLLRWAVRFALTLGVAASVAANILHAPTNPISQVIAAWPPLALLLTVELISRVPVHRWLLGVIRLLATTVIAGIAAWISYHHMVGVVARYGETGTTPYLLPVSVDGLIVVASISLVELNARIRITEPTPAPAPTSVASTSTIAESTLEPEPSVADAAPASAGQTSAAAWPDDGFVQGSEFDERGHYRAEDPTPRPAAGTQVPSDDLERLQRVTPRPDRQSITVPPATPAPADADKPSRTDGDDRAASDPSEEFVPTDTIPTETAAAVAYWYRRDPDLHPAEIGRRIGRSERTVRRYWPPTRQIETSNSHDNVDDLVSSSH
jgi:hypothetical protein